MSNYLKESRDEAIKELAKKGRTFREIAAIYKISFQRVHQIVEKSKKQLSSNRVGASV